jgi:hypothetical protein
VTSASGPPPNDLSRPSLTMMAAATPTPPAPGHWPGAADDRIKPYLSLPSAAG